MSVSLLRVAEVMGRPLDVPWTRGWQYVNLLVTCGIFLLLCRQVAGMVANQQCSGTKCVGPGVANSCAIAEASTGPGRVLLHWKGRFTGTVCPNGRRVKELNCDCKIIRIDDFKTLYQVMLRGDVSCEPVCEDKEQILHRCKTACPEGSEQFVCVYNGCGTNVPAQAVDIIKGATCIYRQEQMMWDCGVLLVENPTYHAVARGACVPTCGPQELSCSFTAHFRAVSADSSQLDGSSYLGEGHQGPSYLFFTR